MVEKVMPNKEEFEVMSKKIFHLQQENVYLKKDNKELLENLAKLEEQLVRANNILSGINAITRGY